MDAAPSRYWIFQAAPEHRDVAGRLKPGETESWAVLTSPWDIAPGDVAYLWQAGRAATLQAPVTIAL